MTTGVKQKALLAIEQVVNRAAARIIVPSEFIREILTQRQGIDPAKVDKVHYGLVSEKYPELQPSEVERFRNELGFQGRFVIGNFSRLHKGKGLSYLIQAMAELHPRLPALLLVIVGEGQERAALEQQIQSLGLGEAVRLLGWRRDAMPLMAAVDAVVQPTLEEAFSQVMVEAQWTGKPLVITDVGGVTDIIRHDRTGLIVPKGDVDALVNAIERLANDPALRERLGLAGKAYMMNHLDIDKIIPKYEQTYLRVMGK